MIILLLFELLALGILAGDLSGQTILTATMVTAKLFIGIQAHHQQSVDFVGFEGLAALELSVDPIGGPAQLRGVHPLAGIAKSIVADFVPVTDPPLPLGEFGFLLQLQQAGDMHHLPQEQAQPDGAGRDLRLWPGIGETTRQQMQIEAFLRIGLELSELGKVGAIHCPGLRPVATVRH